MQFPALGLRGRLLWLGIAPAVLILSGVLFANFLRMQSLVLSCGEELLRERVARLAAHIGSHVNDPLAETATESANSQLKTIQSQQALLGWHAELFLLDDSGDVIASTVQSPDMLGQPISATPYAAIFEQLANASDRGVRGPDPKSATACLYAIATVPANQSTLAIQIPESDILSRVRETLAISAGLAAGGMACVLGLIGWFTWSITRRIAEAAAASKRVAAGDLTGSINMRGSDETGQLLRDIGSMTDSLKSIVRQVKRSSFDLNATSNQLSAAGRQQEAAIGSLGASTSEAAVASRQIAVTGQELLGTMNEVAGVAAETAQVADLGRENLTSIGETMAHLEQSTANFSQRLAVIRQRAEDINMVITTITKVADQTNLLSINAAIEAEKAGDYGQGFIVVAREIRRLADQTAVATLDIERLVEQMQQAVGAGVLEMDAFTAEVKIGVYRVAGISVQFADVIDKVHGLTGRFEHVNNGMQAQASGAQQITEALMTLTEGSRTAAEALRDFQQASQHMAHSVEGLTETVGHFRVDAPGTASDLIGTG